MRLISAKIHSSFFLLTGTCNILAKDLNINILMNKTLLILNENLKRTRIKKWNSPDLHYNLGKKQQRSDLVQMCYLWWNIWQEANQVHNLREIHNTKSAMWQHIRKIQLHVLFVMKSEYIVLHISLINWFSVYLY